ncbi:MAG: glycoside hydrolase family 15 protein, partial [Xanthomonadales bacterium]|nr:glycoside hydrolase family 15 protein [Xanthomonadales bacterium]
MTSAISNLNLGMIGNGTVSALIDECAAMVWACFPTFDGDPAFCSLLQPKIADSGKFEVVLEGFSHGTQRYLDNSAVLSTQLVANDGSSIEVRDFAPRYKQFGRVFHPMGFVRSVRPLSGTPKVRIRMRPLSGYAERIPERRSGSNHVRYLLGETVLRVTTDASLPMLLEEVPFLLDREIHFIIGEDE